MRHSKQRSKKKTTPYILTLNGPDVDMRITVGVDAVKSLIRRAVSAVEPDHYATLGVTQDASPSEIQDAYFAKIAKTLSREDLDRAIQIITAERNRRPLPS